MIPGKYYLENKLSALDNKPANTIAGQIVRNALEKIKLKPQFIEKTNLDPNNLGYVPRDFGRLKAPTTTSRVTGHVRYNGEIVRPHLRQH